MELISPIIHKDEAIIHDIAMNKAPAIQDYLESICTRSEQVLEGVILLFNQKDKSLNKLAQWPQPRELSLAMYNTANAAVTRAKSLKIIPAISSSDNNAACIIASPLVSNNITVGVIALALKTSNNKETSDRLSNLEEVTPVLSTLLASKLRTSRPADTSKLLQLQNVFLSKESLSDAATAFANELTQLSKLRRVSIGLLINQQIKMIAISNNADFKQERQLLVSMSEAMEEAADQTESVVYPTIEEQLPRITLASKALFNITQNPICCTPIIHQGKVIGVIAMEHNHEDIIHKEAIVWYEHIATFLAPLLALKQKAIEPWFKKAISSIQNQYETFFSDHHVVSKALSILCIALLCILSFLPVNYHIGSRAHIEGAIQRIVAAPINGFIHNAKVRPGDFVKKGEILIDLADQDLLLEKEKWESEIIQQENNFSGALARQDRTQYAISQAKAMQARAELALIKQSIERSHITAPIDGIVIEGDLSQSLGAPVSIGDNLLTIAPKDEYRLIVNVDERDIKDIKLEQKGSLALSAHPSKKLHFIVKRITPMATVKDGHNVYEIEANIVDEALYLRPGMQGIAKIEVGKKTILWSLGHHITDWIKLTLWEWGL